MTEWPDFNFRNTTYSFQLFRERSDACSFYGLINNDTFHTALRTFKKSHVTNTVMLSTPTMAQYFTPPLTLPLKPPLSGKATLRVRKALCPYRGLPHCIWMMLLHNYGLPDLDAIKFLETLKGSNHDKNICLLTDKEPKESLQIKVNVSASYTRKPVDDRNMDRGYSEDHNEGDHDR